MPDEIQATPKVWDYIGPAGTDGPNEDQQNLPQELITSLETICRKMDTQELQARIRLVTRVQKARFFQRGTQYLERGKETDGGVYTVKYADPSTLGANEDRDPMYVFNMYWAYGRSFVATFSQAGVGVAFEPNDPGEPSDTAAAKEAENARKLVWKVNNQRDLQKQIGKLLWTDPYVVFLTQASNANAKFGYDKEGNPRAYPEIAVGGALEWKIPIACGSYDEWPYVRYQREIDQTLAKEKYPDKKEKLSGAASAAKDDDYSRQARLSTQEGLEMTQQSGGSAEFMSTESNYWLRPSAFNVETDEKIAATLKQWFPNGCYVCFVGGQYVRSRDESLNDHIEVFKADPGEGYATPALGDIAIGPQEAFNDLANLARTTFVRGVPHRYVDQNMIPSDAIPHQKNNPGTIHAVERPTGEPIAAGFYEETPAETPTTMMTYMAQLSGPLSQFLTGQQPALFGGEMGEAGKTATGYGQALAQALGQMAIVWVPYKRTIANVTLQAINVLGSVAQEQGEISTTINAGTSDAETVTFNANNLKGRILVSPDTDENFPESWSMKRANLQGLMAAADKNPALMQDLAHPDNRRLAKDLLGLKDFVDPEEDSRDKQAREIEQMLKEMPVPDPQAVQAVQQQAAQQGVQLAPEQMEAALQGAPQISSVAIDEDYDDHAVEWATVKSWINSPEGQKARVENPQGFVNVRLHGLQHKKLVDQAQAGQGNQKPPSESINYKDLPPEGQVQLAAKAGIQIQPPQPMLPAPQSAPAQ